MRRSRLDGLARRLGRDGTGARMRARWGEQDHTTFDHSAFADPDFLPDGGAEDRVQRRILEELARVDPDPKGRHVGWMAERIASGGLLREDLGRCGEALALHMRCRTRLPAHLRDLGRLPGLRELEDAVSPFEETGIPLSSAEEERRLREAVMAETRLLNARAGMTLAVPLTTRAARWWGRGTRWCTSGRDEMGERAFLSYSARGPLVVAVLSDGRKFQAHAGSHGGVELRDARDDQVRADAVDGTGLRPLLEEMAQGGWPLARRHIGFDGLDDGGLDGLLREYPRVAQEVPPRRLTPERLLLVARTGDPGAITHGMLDLFPDRRRDTLRAIVLANPWSLANAVKSGWSNGVVPPDLRLLSPEEWKSAVSEGRVGGDIAFLPEDWLDPGAAEAWLENTPHEVRLERLPHLRLLATPRAWMLAIARLRSRGDALHPRVWRSIPARLLSDPELVALLPESALLDRLGELPDEALKARSHDMARGRPSLVVSRRAEGARLRGALDAQGVGRLAQDPRTAQFAALAHARGLLRLDDKEMDSACAACPLALFALPPGERTPPRLAASFLALSRGLDPFGPADGEGRNALSLLAPLLEGVRDADVFVAAAGAGVPPPSWLPEREGEAAWVAYARSRGLGAMPPSRRSRAACLAALSALGEEFRCVPPPLRADPAFIDEALEGRPGLLLELKSEERTEERWLRCAASPRFPVHLVPEGEWTDARAGAALRGGHAAWLFRHIPKRLPEFPGFVADALRRDWRNAGFLAPGVLDAPPFEGMFGPEDAGRAAEAHGASILSLLPRRLVPHAVARLPPEQVARAFPGIDPLHLLSIPGTEFALLLERLGEAAARAAGRMEARAA